MTDMMQAVKENNVHYVQPIPTLATKNENNVQYVVLPAMSAKEGKNFFEGLMWGVHGVQNVIGGISLVGSTLFLDGLAIVAASESSPGQAIVGAVGLAALNVLAYKIVVAEFTIAGKSFTHMKNTIL